MKKLILLWLCAVGTLAIAQLNIDEPLSLDEQGWVRKSTAWRPVSAKLEYDPQTKELVRVVVEQVKSVYWELDGRTIRGGEATRKSDVTDWFRSNLYLNAQYPVMNGTQAIAAAWGHEHKPSKVMITTQNNGWMVAAINAQ